MLNVHKILFATITYNLNFLFRKIIFDNLIIIINIITHL
jgi:hypothetical protein